MFLWLHHMEYISHNWFVLLEYAVICPTLVNAIVSLLVNYYNKGTEISKIS